MRPANVGELMEYLAEQYTPGELCDMLDMDTDVLVYYLKDPIEEKFEELMEAEFGDDEDAPEDAD